MTTHPNLTTDPSVTVDLASTLPIERLITAARVESERYARGEGHVDEFGLELFRRAIRGGDCQAWEALATQYRPLVLGNLRRHPAWPARFEKDDEYWVTRTFQRFLMAVKPDRLRWFPTLPALLAYLKMCAHSVLLDEVRTAHASRLSSLDEMPEASAAAADVAEQVVDELSRRTLWEAVTAELRGGKERVVARLSWVRWMKPVEIYSSRPELFDSVDDVYRIKRNVLDRLRRSERLTELLG